MKKNFSLFLALRYLKPKRTYVSIITLISVVGVTLGVGVLIVVIAVMKGFEHKIKENILAFDPHIALMLEEFRGSEEMDEDTPSRWDRVREKFESVGKVEAVYPFVEGQVLMSYFPNGVRRGVAQFMRAIYEEDAYSMELLREMMVDKAEPDLSGDSIVVSKQMADRYGLQIGDMVTVQSGRDLQNLHATAVSIENNPEIKPEDKGTAIREAIDNFTLELELTITGFFDSLWFQEFIIVRLGIGQDLYHLGNHVHGISVQLDDPYQANAFHEAHWHEVPPFWSSNTWMERHRLKFETIRNERSMMYFILFFIVLVAAFSIMNTMITVTVQKRREIGVMKALGAREGQIVWVFLAQGMLVGIVGTILGLGSGALITEYRNEIRRWLAENVGLKVFPSEMYLLKDIPAKIELFDVGVICVGAFILCSVAALIPAFIAARLDPAKALRD